MLKKLVNENILATKVKIFFARISYFFAILVYGKKPRIITRDGIKFEVDLSEGIDLSLFLFGKYQEHVVCNKLVHIPDDAVIIDVGANMGAMALQYAKRAARGKVYAFEPTDYSMARLRRNIELNPALASRIEVIQSFVSSEDTANPLLKAYASWKVGGRPAESLHPVHRGAVKPAEGVGAVTLDKFCSYRQLPRLDLVKIDTDGHEYEVLAGARETIKKYRPYIIFEAGMYAMKEKNLNFSFFSDYFSSFGYKLYDSIKAVEITGLNYEKYIPANATIDIIAIPESKN